MARVSKEKLESIKEKFNVDILYSWSRLNCYQNSPYEYFLKYIKRIKGTRENIYGYSGNVCHQILEDLYEGKIEYNSMLDIYEEALETFNEQGLKYDRNDNDKNKAIANKYEDCIRHFFKNHKMVEEKMAIEKFVLINIKDRFHLQGYIDAVHKEGDAFIITDFKTSSIYKGAKAEKEKGQLVLYAYALHQMGVPIDKIKIRWAFLKYTDITFEQKNGKLKTMTVERHCCIKKLKSRLKTNLRDLGWDEIDIELQLSECIENNSLDGLPQGIIDLYKFDDCYVYPIFNQTEVDVLVDHIYNTLDKIEKKTKMYNETKDDKVFWDSDENLKKQEYYFACLMEFSPSQHKPYLKYLEDNQMYKKDNEKTDYSDIDIDDDSWLKEIFD